MRSPQTPTPGCGLGKVHIVAHSMGNRVLLNGLRSHFDAGSQLAASIGHIICAAPDTTVDDFCSGIRKLVDQRSMGQQLLAASCTRYFSSRDRALLLSAILARDSRAGNSAILDVEDKSPALFVSVDATNATWRISTIFSSRHSYVFETPEVQEDVRHVLESEPPFRVSTPRKNNVGLRQPDPYNLENRHWEMVGWYFA